MTKNSLPKGVFDIYPLSPKDELEGDEAWKDSALWQYLEKEIRELAHLFGLLEVRTPVFERTELFTRSVGVETDIVSKEMYTFDDKGGRSMSLRPEGTAPAIRALVDHRLQPDGPVHKLYYIGPMFRYERQQLGRYRQHHQFGAEVVGDGSPLRDAELIDLLWTLLRKLGLSQLSLQINSIGTNEARSRYKAALREYLRAHLGALTPDSLRRFETNPLRILDSKEEADQAILVGAPSLLDFLEPDCLRHFADLQAALKELGIPFEVNPRLVRGLDYYNRTVFEITTSELGAQNSLGGGGRYDGLVKSLGGPDLPALGFGAGLERIIQTLLRQKIALPPRPHVTALLLPLGESARQPAFRLLKRLREQGVAAEIDLGERKLKVALRLADQMGVDYVLLLGDEELTTETCTVKTMKGHASERIALDQVIHYLKDSHV